MGQFIACLNGKFIPAKELKLNSKNRSFKYGDGIFETIRVVEGRICFFNAHFERILKGLSFLEIETKGLNKDYLLQIVNQLLKENDITKGARLRIHFWRSEGGFYAPTHNDLNWLAEVEPLAQNFYQFNEEGFQIDIYDGLQKPINALSNIKSANALLYIKAGLEKNKRKLDELLLLNEKGFLAEGISSNLFLVVGESIMTPSLQQGCLEGVMRKQIISLAQYKNIRVVEGAIDREILFRADELFFTNTITGIRWAKAYRNKRFFNKTSKSLNETLNQLLLSSLMDFQEN